MPGALESGRTNPAMEGSLGRFGLDHPRLVIADRDLTRLFGLGNLAHQIDVQKPVLERRTLDLDVVGKLEEALEGARRDALVEHLAALLLVLGFLVDFLAAPDRQRIFLRL